MIIMVKLDFLESQSIIILSASTVWCVELDFSTLVDKCYQLLQDRNFTRRHILLLRS